jgi:DNA-directed RNA polymerase beta subunit
LWCKVEFDGQKGTIGILPDGIDMPFNKYGVRPDIILNPNAIPSKLLLVWNSNILQVF